MAKTANTKFFYSKHPLRFLYDLHHLRDDVYNTFTFWPLFILVLNSPPPPHHFVLFPLIFSSTFHLIQLQLQLQLPRFPRYVILVHFINLLYAIPPSYFNIYSSNVFLSIFAFPYISSVYPCHFFSVYIGNTIPCLLSSPVPSISKFPVDSKLPNCSRINVLSPIPPSPVRNSRRFPLILAMFIYL